MSFVVVRCALFVVCCFLFDVVRGAVSAVCGPLLFAVC